MFFPPIKTGMVFPTDYTAAKLSDKNKARIFSKCNGAFHPMMEKVTSLTPELKRFLKNQPSGNQPPLCHHDVESSQSDIRHS